MKIVIDGAGEVGAHLARMLRAEANEITVIDNDEKRLADLAADSDVETLLGDPSSIQTLKEAGVGKADLFIAVYPYSAQEINLVAALLAKRIEGRRAHQQRGVSLRRKPTVVQGVGHRVADLSREDSR